MKYNYIEEMKDDIIFFMKDNELDWSDYEDESDLLDELWEEDCITGNGPEGYASEEECREFVGENLDLALEALYEYETDFNVIKAHRNEIYSYLDATIRCYLLSRVIHELWPQEDE